MGSLLSKLFRPFRNMKILPRSCLFEIVKGCHLPSISLPLLRTGIDYLRKRYMLISHGQYVPLGIVFYLFRFEGQIYKKGPLEFSFLCLFQGL